MNVSRRICVMLWTVWAASCAAQSSRPATQPVMPSFAQAVNLESFRLLAVQHEGRLKTVDTLARETTQEIAGTAFLPDEAVGGGVLDPVYTYLDMIFRPEAYDSRRLFYVKKKPVRQALTQAARGIVPEDELHACVADGRFSLQVLASEPVRAELEQLSRDVMRTSKDVDALASAVMLSKPEALEQQLRLVPPTGAGDVHDMWHAFSETAAVAQWQQLQDAWRAGDAAQVNMLLGQIAAELPQVAPAVYPVAGKLALEHWYYKYHKMTWVWTFYLAAVVFLLMGVVYQWPWARRTGASFFTLAFALHTVASGIRWYLAGRIPNSNMFEAVTAAAWFGAAVAATLELGPALVRRWWAWWGSAAAAVGGLVVFLVAVPASGASFGEWQRWGTTARASLVVHAVGVFVLIALAVGWKRIGKIPLLPKNEGRSGAGLMLLGASVAGMVAMMCGQFLSVELHSDIGTRMPVLNDLWLYIHTNMIIASYALIGMAFVTAAMYVVGRLLTAPTRGLWWSMVVPAAAIPLVGLLPGVGFRILLPAWAPFGIVVAMTACCWLGRTVGRLILHARPRMQAGGLPGMMALMTFSGVGQGEAASGFGEVHPGPQGGRFASLARVLDGSTMVLIELFFVMLWTGIVMGAIWADHSWGRPWGWDPKEVFALNTWIIFLILVHVRLKVRDKAAWTAVLVVVGTSVMLFNWIVVNFFITGLHSYA